MQNNVPTKAELDAALALHQYAVHSGDGVTEWGDTPAWETELSAEEKAKAAKHKANLTALALVKRAVAMVHSEGLDVSAAAAKVGFNRQVIYRYNGLLDTPLSKKAGEGTGNLCDTDNQCIGVSNECDMDASVLHEKPAIAKPAPFIAIPFLSSEWRFVGTKDMYCIVVQGDGYEDFLSLYGDSVRKQDGRSSVISPSKYALELAAARAYVAAKEFVLAHRKVVAVASLGGTVFAFTLSFTASNLSRHGGAVFAQTVIYASNMALGALVYLLAFGMFIWGLNMILKIDIKEFLNKSING